MLTQFVSRSIVNGRYRVGRDVRQHAEEGEDSEQLHDSSRRFGSLLRGAGLFGGFESSELLDNDAFKCPDRHFI